MIRETICENPTITPYELFQHLMELEGIDRGDQKVTVVRDGRAPSVQYEHRGMRITILAHETDTGVEYRTIGIMYGTHSTEVEAIEAADGKLYKAIKKIIMQCTEQKTANDGNRDVKMKVERLKLEKAALEVQRDALTDKIRSVTGLIGILSES